MKSLKKHYNHYILSGLSISIIAIFTLIMPSSQVFAIALPYLSSNVLGQANFTSSTSNITQNGLNLPQGSAYDSADHLLYVADTGNNRVLVYSTNTGNITNGMNASYVLGQANFTANSPRAGNANATQNNLYTPKAVAYDSADHLLFVADQWDARVLVYNTTNLSNGMNASYVLGEPDFTTAGATTTQNGVYGPEGLAYDSADHLLFVADTGNSRILAYNIANIANGMNASYVLGQPDFTSSGRGTTQNSLWFPMEGLAYDSADHLLFVDDWGNSRILAYNIANIANGMNASYVLGQANFTSSTIGTTQNSLDKPLGLAYDSADHLLFVDDWGNNRILAFNIANIANGMNASSVLGQTNFTAGGSSTTQNSLYNPEGLAYNSTNNSLFISDSGNNRIVLDNFIKMTTSSLANGTIGNSYSQQFSEINSQGTVTYQVTGGSLPPGLSMNSAGLITGTPSTAGSYTFEVTAYDNNGTMGTFVDDPSYTIVVASSSTTSTTTTTTTTKAPNTGFGVSLNRPLQTLAIYGLGAIGLIILAIVVRKKVTK